MVSTSSDKSFRLWDLSPLETKSAPTSRQVVKEHSRPVDSAAYLVTDDGLTVWTADTLGALKQWTIPSVRTGTLPLLTSDWRWPSCLC
jgi:WD40 repeat protein